MRKSRFTTEQIIKVLQAWDAGAKVSELVRQHGVTEQTLYRWKKKYGGMQVNDARRLKALEDENRQLKRIVADQALNLQVVICWEKSGDARAAADGRHPRQADRRNLGASRVSLHELRPFESAVSDAARTGHGVAYALV
jgi:putative transposase